MHLIKPRLTFEVLFLNGIPYLEIPLRLVEFHGLLETVGGWYGADLSIRFDVTAIPNGLFDEWCIFDALGT